MPFNCREFTVEYLKWRFFRIVSTAATSLAAEENNAENLLVIEDSALAEMTIIGLSETSANGAVVDRDATLIYYTPPASNSNATDQFIYTISDGRGGIASATVMIRFAQPLNLSGLFGSEGFTVLSLEGVEGVTYLFQVSTNLAIPNAWETIATNVAVTNGLIRFVDPGPTDVPARYYRVLMP